MRSSEGYVVVIDGDGDVASTVRAIVDAAGARGGAAVHVFSDDEGSTRDPAPAMAEWMRDLFEKGEHSPKVVVMAATSAPKEGNMFEFVGWLPQLEVTLLCVCDRSGAEAIEGWAYQLQKVSAADCTAFIRLRFSS